MNKIVLLKLSDVINTSKIHQKRLEDPHYIIQSWGNNFNLDLYYSLTTEQIAVTDQYVYRFAKLQDLIGEKLFKLVLEFVGESWEKLSHIEILNKLEKLETIESAEQWISLRNERNKITHDYAKKIDEILEDFRILLSKKDVLISYFERTLSYLVKRGLV